MIRRETISGVGCIYGRGLLTGRLGAVKVTNRQIVNPKQGVVVLLRIDGCGNREYSDEFNEWQEQNDFDNDDLFHGGCLTLFSQAMLDEGWEVEEFACPKSRGLVILGKPTHDAVTDEARAGADK